MTSRTCLELTRLFLSGRDLDDLDVRPVSSFDDLCGFGFVDSRTLLETLSSFFLGGLSSCSDSND